MRAGSPRGFSRAPRITGYPPAVVTRAEKARRIAAILGELYPEAGIPLEHEDPFTLLVAVVLSAQCTDAKVNQVKIGRASCRERVSMSGEDVRVRQR